MDIIHVLVTRREAQAVIDTLMGSDTVSRREKEQGKNVTGKKFSCSDSSVSEVVSNLESESDFVPPSPFSPLPLTASEEKLVEQCTRIGLVATHKCSSDILTEDDRREMAAIRRSMGMLPYGRSDSAAGNRGQCVQQAEKYSEPPPHHHLEQDRESVGSSHIISRDRESSGGQWSAETSDSGASDASERSSGKDSSTRSTASCEATISGGQHHTTYYQVHRPLSGRDGERTWRGQSAQHRPADSDNMSHSQRRYCTSSLNGTHCVAVTRPRPNGVRVYQPVTTQRSSPANSDLVVCLLCRNRLRCQHCGRGCPMRNNCFGCQLYEPSLCCGSHSLLPQKASLRQCRTTYLELWGLQSVTFQPPLRMPRPLASQLGSGSYFQQYMMKRKRYRRKGAGYGHLPPMSLPPPPSPLPPPSTGNFPHLRRLHALQKRQPPHRAGVRSYADMYYSRVHK